MEAAPSTGTVAAIDPTESKGFYDINKNGTGFGTAPRLEHFTVEEEEARQRKNESLQQEKQEKGIDDGAPSRSRPRSATPVPERSNDQAAPLVSASADDVDGRCYKNLLPVFALCPGLDAVCI